MVANAPFFSRHKIQVDIKVKLWFSVYLKTIFCLCGLRLIFIWVQLHYIILLTFNKVCTHEYRWLIIIKQINQCKTCQCITNIMCIGSWKQAYFTVYPQQILPPIQLSWNPKKLTELVTPFHLFDIFWLVSTQSLLLQPEKSLKTWKLDVGFL